VAEGRTATVAPVFQLYRFSDTRDVWWRLVSPNGRGMARSAAPFDSVDDARGALEQAKAAVADLVPVLRLTAEFRWQWSLTEGDRTVVQGVGDQDRRVRCVHAYRKFVLLAPVVDVDPSVASFHRAPRAGLRATPTPR
jgi:hypothetical protein